MRCAAKELIREFREGLGPQHPADTLVCRCCVLQVMGKDLYDRDICGWVGIKNVLFLRDRGEGTELVSFL